MSRTLASATTVLLLCATACVTRVPVDGRKAEDLDFKLSMHAWMEEGRIATVIVDTLATRDRGPEPYVPLEIIVANNGLKMVTLTRESFTLVDAAGNRYPAAGPRELLERYEFLDRDRELAELTGIVANKFATYRLYPSQFSPSRSEPQIVRDQVALPKFGLIHDLLYFPSPPNGVMGQRFELFVDATELEDPLFVKFEVR